MPQASSSYPCAWLSMPWGWTGECMYSFHILGGAKRLFWRPCCFTAKDRARNTHWIEGWVGLRQKRKTCAAGNRTQFVPILTGYLDSLVPSDFDEQNEKNAVRVCPAHIFFLDFIFLIILHKQSKWSYSCNRLWNVKVLTVGSQMVVSLSALCTGRAQLPRNIIFLLLVIIPRAWCGRKV
jgi:hypothetical protein